MCYDMLLLLLLLLRLNQLHSPTSTRCFFRTIYCILLRRSADRSGIEAATAAILAAQVQFRGASRAAAPHHNNHLMTDDDDYYCPSIHQPPPQPPKKPTVRYLIQNHKLCIFILIRL